MSHLRQHRMAATARDTALRAALVVALGVIAGTTANAQTPGSVEDFRLPPQASPPAAPVAGPVDADNPVAQPTTAAPTPQVSPQVSGQPTPTAPIALPGPAATSPRRAVPQARDRAAQAPAVTAIPTATPEALPSAIPLPTASETSLTELPPPASMGPSVNTGDSLQWIALAAALLLVSAGLFVWRRRGSMTPESDEPAEAVFEPATSEALPAPREAPPPVVQPPVAPIPAAHTSAAEPAPLEIRLEAQSLTCSLVFANLAYRLMLTNRAGHTSGPLRIAGDMIAAHASLSADDQLSPDGEAMPKLHRVEALAPGESVTVSGQLRMAMTDIAPIRQGQAALFIPLARFDIVGEAGDKAPVTRIFVVGEANEVANGPLKPFRLDRMPGTVRGLDQRDISPLG